MTDAGRKWALELEGPHPDTVERVLRAFCEELKQRWIQASKENPSIPLDGLFAAEFRALERELLGD